MFSLNFSLCVKTPSYLAFRYAHLIYLFAFPSVSKHLFSLRYTWLGSFLSWWPSSVVGTTFELSLVGCVALGSLAVVPVHGISLLFRQHVWLGHWSIFFSSMNPPFGSSCRPVRGAKICRRLILLLENRCRCPSCARDLHLKRLLFCRVITAELLRWWYWFVFIVSLSFL